MDDAEYSVQDLIATAFDQKPVDFQNAFNSIITDRIAQAVYDKKVAFAKDVFGAGPDDLNDDDDDNAEVEDELDFDDDESFDTEEEIVDQEEQQNGETA